MKNYARQQFGCKEAEAVSAAVASVEKVTSGEVVPVVRSYSSRYRRPVLRWILGCQTVFVCSWALGTAALGRPLTPFGLLVFAGLYLLLTAFLFLLPEICPPFLRLLAGHPCPPIIWASAILVSTTLLPIILVPAALVLHHLVLHHLATPRFPENGLFSSGKIVPQ